jgi:hypothetical protein
MRGLAPEIQETKKEAEAVIRTEESDPKVVERSV